MNVRMSAIERAMFSFSASESNFVFCTPISFIGRCPMTVTSGMVRCQSDRFLLSVCCAKSVVGRHAAKAKNRYSLFILPPFLFPTKCTGDNPDIKFIYQF
ncbi:hypothetical protein, partial [Bacteroides congonensis]|uniref:hypothetical protein n=1 Tax=Bacteroides congonensis TaxID=1871006 RepID=UPI0026750BCC